MIEDDCDGCEHHKWMTAFGFWFCNYSDDAQTVHKRIEEAYGGWRISHKAPRVPKFNKVHGVCPFSTNKPLKEGDETLDLDALGFPELLPAMGIYDD
jgi:hypothetical protein